MNKNRNQFSFLTIILFLLVNIVFAQTQIYSLPQETKRGFYHVQDFNTPLDLSNSHKIRIWGEVQNPGVYIVPDYASLIDVLAIAGGPTMEADLSKIKIVNTPTNEMKNKSDFENIIDLEYFLQKGKFQVVPEIGDESVIIIPKNGKTKFFNSLPKILNILNIISLTVILVNWLK